MMRRPYNVFSSPGPTTSSLLNLSSCFQTNIFSSIALTLVLPYGAAQVTYPSEYSETSTFLHLSAEQLEEVTL